MPVRFEGPNGIEELIPAPFISIQKAYIRGPKGEIDHVEYTFTLNGTIVNVDTTKDSPGSIGLTGMEGILAEQKRLRKLFTNDGGRLEIESPGGGGLNTIDAYCTVESINFEEGTWVDRAGYVIVLRSRAIEGIVEPTSELDSYSENWTVTENEDGTFSISHQLQAKGALVYTSTGPNDPMQVAKDWVYARMYTTTTGGDFAVRTPPPYFDLADLISNVEASTNYWNASIVEAIDTYSSSITLTENFIYNPTGNAREDWSASVSYEPDNPRKISITINGNVFGYADKASNLTLRDTNAKNKFVNTVQPNIYTRLTPYVPAGFTVNPMPTSRQINYETGGIIRYSYVYSAVKGVGLITNAIDENVTVSDTGTTDVFAQIQIPGRIKGPVFQNMKTVTSPERTVSIVATLAADETALTVGSLLAAYLAKPNTNTLVDALKPSAGYYYVKQDSEEWNPVRRQYSRTVSWALQNEGISISGIPVAPRNLSPI